MSCPRCGSWSVRRDRSLAGRMVCGNCSLPLGPNASRGGAPRSGLPRLGGLSRLRSWRWTLPLGLLLVSAYLAHVSADRPQEWPPATQVR